MIGTDIKRASELLRAGEVIGVPTETVYGLAGNALDESAIVKIFSVKQRPFFDPLIVHFKDVESISPYVIEIPPLLRDIMEDHMPGPLTVLLERNELIPDLITSGLSRVAVRVPSHPVMQSLLKELDFPLAAPSANPFGYISPTTAQHVDDQLGQKIPYILDGGPCQIGLESTIVGLEKGRLTVYRKGGLSIDKLKKYDTRIKVNDHSDSNPGAPGMLKSHYAPSCSIKIVREFSQVYHQKVGVITFGEICESIPESLQVNLSVTMDYEEAARNLFRSMRLLDKMNLDRIEVKLLPEENLGIAINDRLRRAASLEK